MKVIDLLAVFLGSGLGGVCRYVLSRLIQSSVPHTVVFPWGTFAVNIIGCFLIGLLYGIFDRCEPSGLLSPHIRLLLTVGFCGGFTTFSTFINENYILFQSSGFLLLLGYVAASVVAGFILLYAGYAVTRIAF